MGLLVNGAIGALSAVVGSLAAVSFVGSKLAPAGAILFGLIGFFAAGQIFAAPAAVPVAVSSRKQRGGAAAADVEFDDESAAKAAKKAKKLAAERAKKEAAEQARAEEQAAKAAAKKAEQKKAKKAAPVAAVESESESEAESPEPAAESAAPKSKSALKKAAKKAKEAAAKLEAEKAAKAAEKAAKKAAKKGEAAVNAVAAPVAKAAKNAAAPAVDAIKAQAAAAAAAADLDGWETIEPTKPTKSQLAKAAAAPAVAAAAATSNKKSGSIPASERELTEEIVIPTKFHAKIIGHEGSTLAKLQSGSGARIDMPKRDSNSAKIQITGTPAQVYAARNAIESLAERGFSSITDPGKLSDDLSVEDRDIGLIMGAGGATLKAIEKHTGASIKLPERAPKPVAAAAASGKRPVPSAASSGAASTKKVVLTGQKDQVKAAKAAIRQLLSDRFTTLVESQRDWIKLEVPFPAEKIGALVGKNGSVIRHIQNSTKAQVNLPEKGAKGDESAVSIVGPASQVHAAHKLVLKLLEPAPAAPEPEEEDLATDDAWGQEHTAQGEDALW